MNLVESFGLPSLHSWIRFFVFLLHKYYKINIEKWQTRGDKNKKIVSQNKKIFQEFKEKREEKLRLSDRPKICANILNLLGK